MGRGKGREGVHIITYGRSRMYDHKLSHPYDTGAEHVGFSPNQANIACTKRERREVFGVPCGG